MSLNSGICLETLFPRNKCLFILWKDVYFAEEVNSHTVIILINIILIRLDLLSHTLHCTVKQKHN